MDAEVKGLRGLDVARGAVIAKRFEICEQLGAGGVGMVFRAIDQELEEVIALKLLHPHLATDEAVFKRFRNEVLVARSLSHPNIVRTHDIGRAEAGYSYISMEFIDGTSLKERIQAVKEVTGRGFEFEEALGILFHIVSGVAYAHGRGVIHRDIKPANVMIGSSGEVKLADFGTARIVGADTSLTQTGQVIGTPDYMSPEQIRGEALTAACDVYSLGILAYELVTAERPFVADTAVAIAFKHLHDPTPRLTERVKDVPQWFDDLVQRMTAKRREERFNSAVELVAALVERAPSLSVQSTVFRFDPGAFRRPVDGSGSHSGTGAGTASEPPSLSGAAGHNEFDVTSNHKPIGGVAPRDRQFEMGTPSAARGEGEREWRFDLGSDARDSSSSILPEIAPGRSGLLMIAAAVILVPILLLAVIPRLSSGAYDSIQNMIGVKEEQGIFASMIAGITGVESKQRIVVQPQLASGSKKPSTAVVTPAIASGTPQESGKSADASGPSTATPPSSGVEPTKEQLLADLGISQGTGAKAAGTSGDSPLATDPSKGASSGTAAGAGAVVEPTTVKETAPVQPPEPAPPLEPFSVSLAIRDGARASSGPFPVDRLGSIRWSAEVKGLGSGDKPPAEKEIRSEFSANVFDLKESRVLAKLKVDQVDPGTPGVKPAKLSGSFAQMRNAAVKAGSFRLDLVRSGEVVTSSEFSVYRMQVSLGEAGATGGQQISIVTDATLPGSGSAPPPVTGSTSGGVSGIPSGGTSAANTGAVQPNPVTVTPPPVGAVPGGFGSGSGVGSGTYGVGTYGSQPANPVAPPYGGGLPPAVRGKGETVPMTNPPPIAVAPVSQPPGTGVVGAYGVPPGAPAGTPPVAASTLRYAGTFTVTPNDVRPLSLQFTITGTKLAGSAEIGGYGEPFSVEGDVFDRGLSLTLQNGSYWIKLSSGKAERSLRGRYSSPQEQRNGSFEASRIN